MVSRYLRAAVADPGVRAGGVGGLVTSASAVVGYFVLPTLDAGGPWADGWWRGFETLLAGDPLYSAGVLVVPAALTAFLGVGVARRRGVPTRRAALSVVGVTAGVTVLAAFGAFLLGVAFVAATVALGATSVLEGALVFVTVIAFGIAIAGVFGVVAAVATAALVVLGSVSGCLLALGVERGRRALSAP